jgi:hypothetical protein
MRKGFFSFLLVATFLFSLVLTFPKFYFIHDKSYEKFREIYLEEISLKRISYSYLSLLKPEDYDYEKARIIFKQKLSSLQEDLRNLGYDLHFWCGPVSDFSLLEASEKMQKTQKAEIPEGATFLDACLPNIDVDFLNQKIIYYDLGISFYSKNLGLGKAFILPYYQEKTLIEEEVK